VGGVGIRGVLTSGAERPVAGQVFGGGLSRYRRCGRSRRCLVMRPAGRRRCGCRSPSVRTGVPGGRCVRQGASGYQQAAARIIAGGSWPTKRTVHSGRAAARRSGGVPRAVKLPAVARGLRRALPVHQLLERYPGGRRQLALRSDTRRQGTSTYVAAPVADAQMPPPTHGAPLLRHHRTAEHDGKNRRKVQDAVKLLTVLTPRKVRRDGIHLHGLR
jgi:hypothetical protein